MNLCSVTNNESIIMKLLMDSIRASISGVLVADSNLSREYSVNIAIASIASAAVHCVAPFLFDMDPSTLSAFVMPHIATQV